MSTPRVHSWGAVSTPTPRVAMSTLRPGRAAVSTPRVHSLGAVSSPRPGWSVVSTPRSGRGAVSTLRSGRGAVSTPRPGRGAVSTPRPGRRVVCTPTPRPGQAAVSTPEARPGAQERGCAQGKGWVIACYRSSWELGRADAAQPTGICISQTVRCWPWSLLLGWSTLCETRPCPHRLASSSPSTTRIPHQLSGS